MMSDEGYQDRILTCRDCGNDFTFSAGEQSFFASKGLTNAPSRCPDCRAQRRGGHTNNTMRAPRERGEQYEAVCATCGRTTSVPFIPREDRPVYCNECFQAQRASRPPRRDDTRSYSMSYSGDSGNNSGGGNSGGNRGRDRRDTRDTRDSRDFGRRDGVKRGRRDDRWEERW